MIAKEEYLARAAAQDDWAPGWDAVTEPFDRLYPGVEPRHLASNMGQRAMFGGDQYLDGISLYPTSYGSTHLLTYGMSTLYVDEEAFGGEFSGWGYELTMKVAEQNTDECLWAADSMSRLARYTYTSKKWFEPFQFVGGGGLPLRVGTDSNLTSYLVVPDTEVPTVDTVHGKVEFLQLVGITEAEFAWLAEPNDDPTGRGRELAKRMTEAGNPYLVTDLDRTESFV